MPLSVRFSDRARSYTAGALLLAALAFFLHWVNRFYPIQHWLAWRYGTYFLVASAFVLSCASAGDFLTRKVRGASLPLREHAVQSLAIGLLAFVTGWFVLGVLGLMNRWTAVAWPILLGAPNAWPLYKKLARAAHALHHVAPRAKRRSVLWYAAFTFGVIGLALVYVPLLSPENAAFDARWYHQAIAEHYASDGGIRPFREGWFVGAYPQLATYIYSWAYSLPGTGLFDQVELSFHLEFALFLYTLASVPVLVRRLSPRAPVALAWVSIFAFPELFCYDSLLAGAADHIAGALAIPLFLALLRALPRLAIRECAVLGLVTASVILAKYSIYAMVLVVAGAAVARAFGLGISSLRRPRGTRDLDWLLGPLVLAGVSLAASATHWLKNVVWYRDPLYPLLHAVLPSHPPVTEPAKMTWFVPKEWVAERSAAGVLEAVKSGFTFSFVPHDWWEMHRDVPIFGSLFTLSIPCLLLVRRPGRLVLLYGAVHFCVMQWFWSFHQDRYLQSYVPWMAAGIAAVAAQLWQLGWFARVGASALFVAQIIWGGDVPFFQTHSMSGSALKTSIDLLSSGYRGDYVNRYRSFGAWSEIRRALPEGARVLIHEEHLRSGLGVPAVSDAAGWQAGIDYGQASTPDRMYDLFRGLGITHLMWINQTSRVFDSVAGDIAFFDFVLNFAERSKRFGGYNLARMPGARPPAAMSAYTAVLGCGDTYTTGLYRTSSLTIAPALTPRPKSDYPPPDVPLSSPKDLKGRTEHLDAILVNPRCASVDEKSLKGFVFAANRGAERLYVRKR